MSTTGNADSVSSAEADAAERPDLKLTLKPLLHRHYGSELTRDEIDSHWDAVMQEYSGQPQFAASGVSTDWFFEFETETGTGANNGTDGKVHGAVWFRSDLFVTIEVTLVLDNPGNDREGGWDRYFFVASHSKPVSWLSIKKHRVELKGTDGWYVETVRSEMYPHMQSGSSSGGSVLETIANDWLDNNNSGNWDRYTSQNYPAWWTGTLSF
jgi:hypothetical protein